MLQCVRQILAMGRDENNFLAACLTAAGEAAGAFAAVALGGRVDMP